MVDGPGLKYRRRLIHSHRASWSRPRTLLPARPTSVKENREWLNARRLPAYKYNSEDSTSILLSFHSPVNPTGYPKLHCFLRELHQNLPFLGIHYTTITRHKPAGATPSQYARTAADAVAAQWRREGAHQAHRWIGTAGHGFITTGARKVHGLYQG